MQSTKEILQNNNNSIAIAKDYSKAIDTIETKADKNKKVEQRATMLMETLRAEPKWLRFFCKVYYKLNENQIQLILEGARKAHNPQRYFCAAAKRELDKYATM